MRRVEGRYIISHQMTIVWFNILKCLLLSCESLLHVMCLSSLLILMWLCCLHYCDKI